MLTSVGLMFFQLVSYFFSLNELDVFFRGDWRRELVVCGMHVRTLYFVFIFIWYGLYLVRGKVR